MSEIDWGHGLVIAGWKRETVDADTILAMIWWESYSHHSTVEQLLYRPLECLALCDDFRRNANVWMETNDILKRLTNLRKNNFLECMRE